MNSSPSASKPITVYIDADACPVKQEIYRVAERRTLKDVALKLLVFTNSLIACSAIFLLAGGRTQNQGTLLLASG